MDARWSTESSSSASSARALVVDRPEARVSRLGASGALGVERPGAARQEAWGAGQLGVAPPVGLAEALTREEGPPEGA
jgi:hypothetical protein